MNSVENRPRTPTKTPSRAPPARRSTRHGYLPDRADGPVDQLARRRPRSPPPASRCSRNPERRKEAVQALENLAATASYLKHLLLIRDLRKIASERRGRGPARARSRHPGLSHARSCSRTSRRCSTLARCEIDASSSSTCALRGDRVRGIRRGALVLGGAGSGRWRGSPSPRKPGSFQRHRFGRVSAGVRGRHARRQTRCAEVRACSSTTTCWLRAEPRGALCELVEGAGASVAGCARDRARVRRARTARAARGAQPDLLRLAVTRRSRLMARVWPCPVVSRSRTVPAAPERLWTAVADPACLPDWWAGRRTREDASREAWTTVLQHTQGRTLRADYTLLESDHPRRLSWRHEVDESPFERIPTRRSPCSSSNPSRRARRARLTTRPELRGMSKLGGLQVSRATRKQLDEALDGLQALAERWRGP